MSTQEDRKYRELTAADGDLLPTDEIYAFTKETGCKTQVWVSAHSIGRTGTIADWLRSSIHPSPYLARRLICSNEEADLIKWLESVKGGLNSPNNVEKPHVWIASCAGATELNIQHFYGDTYLEVLRKAKAGYVPPVPKTQSQLDLKAFNAFQNSHPEICKWYPGIVWQAALGYARKETK